MKVLISGGAGFIGSTIASACIDEGITPVILDNLHAGRSEFMSGRFGYVGDIADGALIDRIFAEHPEIGAVIHCAARIVVAESVAEPVDYYRVNVGKSIEFFDHLVRNGCERFIFSSTAAFFKPGSDFSVDENSELLLLSPYARTKAIFESALQDFTLGTPTRVLSLRYFNPVGADPKMRTGQPIPRPSHALGKLIEALETDTPFEITGTDYPTSDGSTIRDYIHVWDLATAHVAALRSFDQVLPADGETRYDVINLGTGRGTTVRELHQAFENVVGQPIPTVDAPRRPGDTVGAFTHTAKAAEKLGWSVEHSLEEGIRDTLRWFEVRNTILDS